MLKMFYGAKQNLNIHRLPQYDLLDIRSLSENTFSCHFDRRVKSKTCVFLA